MNIAIILEYCIYIESKYTTGYKNCNENFRYFNKYFYDSKFITHSLLIDFINHYYSSHINEWFKKIIKTDEYYLLLKDLIEKQYSIFNYLPYISIYNNDKLICKLFKYNTRNFKDFKKRYVEHFLNKNSNSKLQFLKNKEKFIKIYNEGDKSIKDYLPENFKYILD